MTPHKAVMAAEAGAGGGGGFLTVPSGGFLAVADAELGDDLGDVELGAVRADAQLAADLRVRLPLPYKLEYLPLAGSEHVWMWRPASPGFESYVHAPRISA
jgi:hypothetical protein